LQLKYFYMKKSYQYFIAASLAVFFLIINIQSASAVSLPNPIGVTDPNIVFGRIIFALMGLVGTIALIMFIFGGYTWMTAAGNDERVAKGRDTLIWATLGLVLVFASYAVLRTVFANLTF